MNPLEAIVAALFIVAVVILISAAIVGLVALAIVVDAVRAL